ncbi:single-stranded DNA-binding protein [Lysinibacillus telephonicus]|uniref:single-stranded DNA-binding protein n=1 Tax=Lysinibacillus telephonicus TaxID=1714840 RepID=UPI0037D91C25
MINSVVLTGRLTKDVDLSYTPNGVPSAKFVLAVNRAFKNQNGEQEADFINIQVWRKQAENSANYLKKGSLVGIVGRLQSGSYEKDGQRIYFTNVVAESVQFLEPRSNSSDGSNSAPNYQGNTNYQSSNQNSSTGQYGGQIEQQNYNQLYEDPFAPSKGPIVDESDLPF